MLRDPLVATPSSDIPNAPGGLNPGQNRGLPATGLATWGPPRLVRWWIWTLSRQPALLPLCSSLFPIPPIFVCLFVCLKQRSWIEIYSNIISGFLFVCLFVWLFRAVPIAYGGSQARGPIGAAAAGLHHSHSSTRSKPCLWPTSQVMATLDP